MTPHSSNLAKLLVLLCAPSAPSGVIAVAAAADIIDPLISPPPQQQQQQQIHTLMCENESCTNADANTPGCRQYATPLDACYNAKYLFPGDESWSDSDIWDETIMRNIKRTFYGSKDGSCDGRAAAAAGDGDGGDSSPSIPQPADGEDSFILPTGECVGPFGPPRPWGKFSLVGDHDYEDME